MQQRTPSPFLSAVFPAFLAFASLGLGACSLTLDTQKAQCSRASDCDSKIGGSKTQLCVQGFCQAVTCEGETQKEADDSCRTRKERKDLEEAHCTAGICQPLECRANGAGGAECGENQACDIARNVCVDTAKAACGEDKDCAKYEGIEDYICENKLCAEPECRKDAECEAVGATASCVAGRCDDVTWGCVGEPDDRMSEGPATYRLKILAFTTRKPVPGLVVKACAFAVGDRDCDTAIADATYDEETGFAEVKDLEPRQPFRLRITPPKDSGLLGVDFYSQLTPVGDTTEVGESLLVPTDLVSSLDMAFESQDVNVETDEMGNLALGNLIARVFDCTLKPAKNVRITYESQSASTLTYYLDESLFTPHTDWTESDETGVGGVINLKINGPSEITIKHGEKTVSTFSALFRPGVLTSINFYPRAFGRAP